MMTSTRASASLGQLARLKEEVRQAVVRLEQLATALDDLTLTVEADEARHQREFAAAKGDLQGRDDLMYRAQRERDQALEAAKEIPALRARAEAAEGKLRNLQAALRLDA